MTPNLKPLASITKSFRHLKMKFFICLFQAIHACYPEFGSVEKLILRY